MRKLSLFVAILLAVAIVFVSCATTSTTSTAASVSEPVSTLDLSGYSYTVDASGYPVSSDGYRYADYIPAPTATREERADLSDEDWVNFRLVSTTGMGTQLYRSSSPINPYLGRTAETDAMFSKYGIKTALNFGNSEEKAKSYAAYAGSYYSTINVVYLPGKWMSDYTTFNVWYPSKDSATIKQNLATAFRAIIESEGPIVIHCTWGKDRTGISVAILEALMGASWDEIKADYVKSYYNFFGVDPDSEEGQKIIKYQIELQLKVIFNENDLSTADLAQCAKDYIISLGLTEAEVEALKTKLGQ